MADSKCKVQYSFPSFWRAEKGRLKMQSTIVRATRAGPFCDVIDRQLATKWQRSLQCLRDFQTSIFDCILLTNWKHCCGCVFFSFFPPYQYVDAFIYLFIYFSSEVALNYSETATHCAIYNVLGATRSLACTRLWRRRHQLFVWSEGLINSLTCCIDAFSSGVALNYSETATHYAV